MLRYAWQHMHANFSKQVNLTSTTAFSSFFEHQYPTNPSPQIYGHSQRDSLLLDLGAHLNLKEEGLGTLFIQLNLVSWTVKGPNEFDKRAIIRAALWKWNFN